MSPKSRSFYVRCCQVALVVMLLASPWVIYGAMRASEGAANTPLDWMPLEFEARGNYEQFRKQFESGDVVVIGWPGATVDDPRTEKLAAAIETAPHAVDPQGRPWFERVLTGGRMLEQLMHEPLNLPRSQALQRLRGSLVGPDLNHSWCVVVFSYEGLQDRARAVEFVQHAAEHVGVPRDEQHLAGPVVDGLSVDLAGQQSLRRYAGVSALAILLLGWWCLRSLRVAAVVFGLALYCALVSLSLVHYFGDTMNAVMIVMPPLVVVLGVSGGIHLVNYLYDAIASEGQHDLARRAVAEGWLPCALSAGTTAIGLASLVISDMVPIRMFGMYSAVGVALTFVLLLAVLPGAFEWSPWLAASAAYAERQTHAAHVQTPQPFAPPHWTQHWALFVIRYRTPIVVAAFFVMGLTGYGLPSLRASVRIETLFNDESTVIRDTRWLEKRVAPLVPIEVIVRFNRDATLEPSRQLLVVRDIEERLAKLPKVGGTMSAVTFLPELKTGRGIFVQSRRSVIDKLLEKEEHRNQLVDIRYLHEAPDHIDWRVTVRVSALADIDYGEFLDEVQAAVEPLLAQATAKEEARQEAKEADKAKLAGEVPPESNEPHPDRKPGESVSAVYTGVMPLVHEVQHELLRNLFTSFLGALVVISLVMIVLERSIVAGMVSMISNVFPIVVLFGILGSLRKPIDIGSVMTASVALGMAIDGTLHFLTFFHRGLYHGENTAGAVQAAYRHCAGAMIQSTVTCGLGIMVFVFSSFVPTSRFAWMIVLLLLLALVGDLVVLPALLTGPAGKFFKRRIARDPGQMVESTLSV